MTETISNQLNVPSQWDRAGLPGWAYFSEELFSLEQEVLFRQHWQLVGHVNTIKDIGSYITFDIANERALIIKGSDGEIRAFHNLCRHRGSRVVPDEKGKCNKSIVCPYHGWTYGLDGSTRGVARKETFPKMDRDKLGLIPLNMEISFCIINYILSLL